VLRQETFPTLQSVSDLRAAAIIARAQGLDETAANIDQQVQDILKQSSGITRFVDKFFNETVDGDAKGKAGLDRLGFEYTVDKKTGNPIFSAEQIAANKAKSSKPKPEPIISTASSGPTGIAGERIVSTPTKPKIVSTQKESEAAARKRRRERQRKSREAAKAAIDKRKTAVKKAKSISSKVKGEGAKALDARKKKSKAFDKGGLMNKKGDK